MSSNTKQSIPNFLTIARILFVFPFLIVMALWIANRETWGYFYSAGAIFALAMITDFVDGYLARKWNVISDFGKLFDPLADKFMTTSALIMLAIAGVSPFWLPIVFVLRDILVDGSRNVAAKNNVNIAASFWGKAKTMLQSIGIVLIFSLYPIESIGFGTCFIGQDFNAPLFSLNLPLIIAAILSLISGWNYFKAIIPYIKTK